MKFNLLDNAYMFINESIKNARSSKRDQKYWTFAILHLTQSLELLMKKVLENEHPCLIFENIDNPKSTVSISLALDRIINISGIDIDKDEISVIKRASQKRNEIVHYEYELNEWHMQSIYLELFEFVHHFHIKHLGSELHDHIDKKLWRKEAELLHEFKNEWIIYRGEEVHSHYPFQIIAIQKYNGLRVGSKGDYKYHKRYRHGMEPFRQETTESKCDDCSAEIGELHVIGCDLEYCPICHQQLHFLCKCEVDFWIVKDDSRFEPWPKSFDWGYKGQKYAAEDGSDV